MGGVDVVPFSLNQIQSSRQITRSCDWTWGHIPHVDAHRLHAAVAMPAPLLSEHIIFQLDS